MIKPWQTLFFLLSVAAICALLMFVFPENGISIGNNITLKFASFSDFTEKDTTERIDVKELLKSYEEPFDSTAIKDSIKQFEWNEKQKRLRISYSNANNRLPHFFKAIDNYDNSEKVRIIHYGDSQIEGDRISSYIRDKFQKQYGGYGPNYVPAVAAVPSMSIKQENSDNWKRYTVFGRKDTTLPHNFFGAYGIFGKYTSFLKDSDDTVNAWIDFNKSNLGYSGTRTYRRIEMMYGKANSPFRLRIMLGDSIFFDEWIDATNTTKILRWGFSTTPEQIRFEFESVHSPDIYGFFFEDRLGFAVDNVAMRGSSGTIFSKINSGQLATHYSSLSPSLILLQYGGNTVPYINSKKRADQYGDWFKGQIQLVKRLNPQADIIVIGPSDMATKEKTSYVTFPYLVEVRDALKKATLDAGCGFWDIYEVMGGRNSMQSWVESDPPLAAKDYVHFTPRGARHVAELFYDALMKDYQDHRVKVEEQEKLLEEKKRQDSIKLYEDSLITIQNSTLEN